MSILIVYNQWGMVEGEHVLDKERFTLGRKSSNDIFLPHAAVSSEHALIITISNDSFLEDLDSTNGVRVNNLLVKKCVLQDGDEIKIGKYLLKYSYEELPLSANGAKNDSDRLVEPDTVVVKRSALKDMARNELDLATTHRMPDESGSQLLSPAPVCGVKAGIRMLSGPGAGKELGLEKMLTTIGKPGLQVAVITRRSKGYFLTHIEGGNFPLLNGSPVGPHSRELKNRDVIELADIRMEFVLK